ncbi:MAG: hypothetical protein FRX49_13177 [Trebouxia sp. A1-2]|nr:MAG: hypothetical protein FRX49_13177 [Trebouxia sp. A1-2]
MIAATVDLQQGQQAVRDAVLDNPSKRRPALCFDGLCEKETSDPKVMDAWSHEIDELILGEDIKKSDGLFLFDKAESGSDCLHVPTNVNLVARLVTVTKVVTPSATHAVPVIEWRTDYQAALAALIRMLQRHRKLDPSFHATLETKSRNSTQKVIDLKEAPGHMHPLEAMQYGELSLYITMACAARKLGCRTSLCMGAWATDIFQPVYHDNDRAYASLYFKFASSQPYQSNARQWLHVPDFQQPIECSCREWHAQLRGVSESSTDFDRMRQGELKAALAVYADKSGRVDATSVLSRIRQRTHAASLQTGGAVMTQTKLDQLASLSRCNKYGLGSPPEVVMARLRKRLLTVLQAKNQDFGLSSI